ncbi:MAG: eight-cysteine-cluster domain-containing protein [Nanobdellota archaeon]
MAKKILILATLALLLFAGCSSGEFGEEEAAETAEKLCEANVSNPTYNENSKTWWFDTDLEKEGCDPACVVHNESKAEINWRCTGLKAPENETKPEKGTEGSSDEFCGVSTRGDCQQDSDCIEAGCSGHVCQSRDESERVTTCEYKECYDSEGHDCRCINGKCMWD